MLDCNSTESRRYRRCPSSGLLCIVCPRSGACLIAASEQARADFQELFAKLDARCLTCKGVRFRTCTACGLPPNSFHDHRDEQRPRQVYETRSEWREVNGTPEPSIPERKAQP